VGGDGAPHLRLHCVLAVAQEMFDAQVLLDPLEEQLDLPPALVQRADGQCRQRRVVCQEDQRLARLGVLESNAPQMLGILLGRIVAVEHRALVAEHTRGAVGGRRLHAPCVHGRLGPRDEEGAGLMQRIQAREV